MVLASEPARLKCMMSKDSSRGAKPAANPPFNSLPSMNPIPFSLPLALWGDLDQHLMNCLQLPSTICPLHLTGEHDQVPTPSISCGPSGLQKVSLRLPWAHKVPESCPEMQQHPKKRPDYEATLSSDLTGLDYFLFTLIFSKFWDMSIISKTANKVIHAQIKRNCNFPP